METGAGDLWEGARASIPAEPLLAPVLYLYLFFNFLSASDHPAVEP